MVDVWRITIAALRRWYVLFPLLALTGLLVMTSGNQVAPEYEAQTTAMITPEKVLSEVPNPYDTITNANNALGIVLSSTETKLAMREKGLSTDYEIGAESRSTIFRVIVRADTADIAERTANAVVALARQELESRQAEAGLPAQSHYGLAVLESPTVTGAVQTGKLRVQAVVGVLGAGLSLLIAVLFDDLVGLWRRARARLPRVAVDSSEQGEPPGPPSTGASQSHEPVPSPSGHSESAPTDPAPAEAGPLELPGPESGRPESTGPAPRRAGRAGSTPPRSEPARPKAARPRAARPKAAPSEPSEPARSEPSEPAQSTPARSKPRKAARSEPAPSQPVEDAAPEPEPETPARSGTARRR